jgi:hypothetical protein
MIYKRFLKKTSHSRILPWVEGFSYVIVATQKLLFSRLFTPAPVFQQSSFPRHPDRPPAVPVHSSAINSKAKPSQTV